MTSCRHLCDGAKWFSQRQQQQQRASFRHTSRQSAQKRCRLERSLGVVEALDWQDSRLHSSSVWPLAERRLGAQVTSLQEAARRARQTLTGLTNYGDIMMIVALVITINMSQNTTEYRPSVSKSVSFFRIYPKLITMIYFQCCLFDRSKSGILFSHDTN